MKSKALDILVSLDHGCHGTVSWLRVEFEEIGGTYLLCDEIYGSD